MSTPVRVLLVLVDSGDDDAAAIGRALTGAGFAPDVVRVHDEPAYLAALRSQQWDLVISDDDLTDLDSSRALALLRSTGLDLPFIVVSGAADEEAAIDVLRAGAHDFVSKYSMARLGPAVERELADARHRAEGRRAEQSLGLQRDFLRLVLDSSPGLMFVKNPAGRYTMANRAMAELYGTTVDGLLGRLESEFNLDADEVELALRSEDEVRSTGRSVFVAAQPVVDRRTGATRWFEVRKVPLLIPDEDEPHVLGIAVEITERKSAEEALRLAEDQFRQAQKMEAIGQLAGGVAHDFNNLLTAILGYTDLLRERLKDQPDLSADLDEIRRAGEKAGSLTKQLLTFSRKNVLQPQVLDLNAVVSELDKMLRRVIGEDVELQTVEMTPLSPIKADPNQIGQILMNLAVNARDAMPRGGVLRIETAHGVMPASPGQPTAGGSRASVVLKISDTGVGMTPQVRDRIFEPFFTTKGAGKGTGLGLSNVYGIVSQSGGLITVESERNKGTTFLIHLPAVTAAPAVAATSVAAGRVGGGTETILLVEDEVNVRELVRRILLQRGYHVLEALDVHHAATLAREFAGPIHLLLSDIVMPGLSGPDLAQRIVARRPEMRVLYMSGFANRLNTDLGALSSGVGILHKPFTPEGLVQRVRESLNVPVV